MPFDLIRSRTRPRLATLIEHMDKPPSSPRIQPKERAKEAHTTDEEPPGDTRNKTE